MTAQTLYQADAADAVERPLADRLTEAVSLIDLGLVPDDAGAAAANVTAWTDNVKPYLDAGGRVRHGPYKFYINDALPGPTGTNWAYETVPNVSAFEQVTDDCEILLFICSQPGGYETRVCPSYFHLGGFVALWSDPQPLANTRSIAIAFKATEDIPDGIFAFTIGEGLFCVNGRDGIAIHPDTVSEAHNFPVWGCRIVSPRNSGDMSGTAIRLGNWGSNGAPKIVITGVPYFYGNTNDGNVPLIHLRNAVGPTINDAEFNIVKNNTVFFEICRGEVMTSPRFEVVVLEDADSGLIMTSGPASDLVILKPEILYVTCAVGGGNKGYLFENYQGTTEVISPIIGYVTITSGTLIAAWPRDTGRINFHDRANVPSLAGFTMADTGDLARIGAGDAQSFQFVRETLTTSMSAVILDPLRPFFAPQAGDIAAMKYDFIADGGSAEPVTAGSGTVTLNKNGSATSLTSNFSSSSNASGGIARVAPMVEAFAQGDKIEPVLTTTGSFAPTTGNLRVTVYLVYR